MSIRVTDLFVYPIKSCKGVRVQSLNIEAHGPEFDRQYMLVDELGQFITQRQIPAMQLIVVKPVDQQRLDVTAKGQELIIRDEVFTISDDLSSARVWKDQVAVKVASQEVNAWFTNILERPCKLVKLKTLDARQRKKTGFETPFFMQFADGAPILLTNQQSLSMLNAQIPAGPSLSMERFRPNIVIDGVAAYAEDTWSALSIGTLKFDFTWPCVRCVIPTVDPETGKRGVEPLVTLGKYHKLQDGICFGMNLVHANTGRIHVGDLVQVR